MMFRKKSMIFVQNSTILPILVYFYVLELLIENSEEKMLKNKYEIIKVLNNGGVIAYVTYTVWGLRCLPNNEQAVKNIYDIKKREVQKPLILMSNNIYNLLNYVKPIPKVGQILIKKYFPGALTIVTEKIENNPN